MKFEVNVEKRHVFLIVGSLFVLAGVIGVFAVKYTGYDSENAPGPGHGGSNIWVEIPVSGGGSGVEMTLQNALSQSKIGSIGVTCINKRSALGFSKDIVSWCPNSHKKLIHCSGVDNKAADIPTDMSDMVDCLDDGECSGVGKREPKGGENMYLEIVKKAGDVEGCWAYDPGHNRVGKYKLDLVCCKI